VVGAVSASRRTALCVNSGSSSVKFALFAERSPGEERIGEGAVEDIGQPDGGAWLKSGEARQDLPPAARDSSTALMLAFTLAERLNGGRPQLVGHRVVHGGARHAAPARVDASLLADLDRLVPLAPLHLPAAIEGMRAAAVRWPGITQVACFDTAFHASMPEVAWRLPLPDALVGDQVRRYGFHGLSYEYIVSVLGASLPPRIVIAHLGNGASLVAIKDGRAMDTTMGMTPAGGIMMGTRSGDLDPGALIFLAREKKLSPDDLERICEREAGLLAVGGSADMRALLKQAVPTSRATLAVSMFGYAVRKAIGALAAALGGLDLLVFTGGIGEHAPEVRAEACRGLEAFGVELDPERNRNGADPISLPASRCLVRVIRTDEDLAIVRHCWRFSSSPPVRSKT
jgi:acetate kinase